jgi:hypothetical protein
MDGGGGEGEGESAEREVERTGARLVLPVALVLLAVGWALVGALIPVVSGDVDFVYTALMAAPLISIAWSPSWPWQAQTTNDAEPAALGFLAAIGAFGVVAAREYEHHDTLTGRAIFALIGAALVVACLIADSWDRRYHRDTKIR